MARERERMTPQKPKRERLGKPNVGVPKSNASAPPLPNPEKRIGRPLGSVNKIPQRFTEAIEFALTMHGMDGKGKNGLPGYFYFLAATDSKAMAHLIARIMPQKVQPTVDPQSALGQVLEAVRAKLAFERSKTINGVTIK